MLRTLQSCSAGAAPANGSAGCAPCAPGTFAPANAPACLPCRAGHYALGGASACTQCPEDHFCADPAQSPAPCAKRAGTPSPASQSYYALPGSTKCWPQCALATAQGASKMIFHAPQPCTGGFTDLPWQALWPAAPAAGTERSLFTGEAPSASAALAGHVFVASEVLAAWYGPILALVLWWRFGACCQSACARWSRELSLPCADPKPMATLSGTGRRTQCSQAPPARAPPAATLRGAAPAPGARAARAWALPWRLPRPSPFSF